MTVQILKIQLSLEKVIFKKDNNFHSTREQSTRAVVDYPCTLFKSDAYFQASSTLLVVCLIIKHSGSCLTYLNCTNKLFKYVLA
jgi:hypothetical protein